MDKLKKKAPNVELTGLDTAALDAMEELFTAYISHAETAARQAKIAAKIAPDESMFRNTLTYWTNVTGGLRWVRGHFRRKRKAHEQRAATESADAS